MRSATVTESPRPSVTAGQTTLVAAAYATGDHVAADYLFVELDAGHWLPELNPDEVVGAVLDRIRHLA
jgi:hypothetical protein